MVLSILDIPKRFHSGVKVIATDDVAPEYFFIFGGIICSQDEKNIINIVDFTSFFYRFVNIGEFW